MGSLLPTWVQSCDPGPVSLSNLSVFWAISEDEKIPRQGSCGQTWVKVASKSEWCFPVVTSALGCVAVILFRWQLMIVCCSIFFTAFYYKKFLNIQKNWTVDLTFCQICLIFFFFFAEPFAHMLLTLTPHPQIVSKHLLTMSFSLYNHNSVMFSDLYSDFPSWPRLP